MVMKALRDSAAGGVFKFIIFGFLFMAVGGMALMDVGGFFRNGGISGNDAARVGNSTVSMSTFDHLVRRSLAQANIPVKEAWKLGYIEQLLQGEISARLLSQSAGDAGIIVDDRHVAKEVSAMIAPMVQPGQKPKDVLRQILASQGMSEADIATAVRRDLTLKLLQGTIQGGFASVSDSTTRDLFAFQNEKRDVQYVIFSDKDVADIAPPTEEQLTALYEAGKESSAKPETRNLKLLKIKADALKRTIDITDEEVKNYYEDNIELYSRDTQHTLEQAVLESEDDAKALVEKVKGGATLEQAARTMKRDSSYLGEKTYEPAEIPADIKKEIGEAKKGDVIGPVKTALGYRVAVVKSLEPAQVTSMDNAKAEIRKDLMETKLADQQYEVANRIDDSLAGGASLEDLRKEGEIEITDLPVVNRFGLGPDNKDALKPFEQYRNIITGSGFDLSEGETSPMTETSDGVFVAVHVEKVTPKTYTPFEESRPSLEKLWNENSRRTRRIMAVSQHLAELGTSAQDAPSFAKTQGKSLQSANALGREDKMPSPFTDSSREALFNAEPGKPFPVEIDGGSAIAWVTSSRLPETVDTGSESYKKFAADLKSGEQNEAVMVYVGSKRKKYGASVNHRLLEQVYGQSPDNESN